MTQETKKTVLLNSTSMSKAMSSIIRSSRPVSEIEYNILLRLAKGEYRVPKKERTKEEKNANLKFWRNKNRFTVQDVGGTETLFKDGKQVLTTGNLTAQIVNESKRLNRTGARTLSNSMKNTFTGCGVKSISKILKGRQTPQKLRVKFTNMPLAIPVNIHSVFERLQIDLIDLKHNGVEADDDVDLKQEGAEVDDYVYMKQEEVEADGYVDMEQEGTDADDNVDLEQEGADADDDVDLKQEGPEADDGVDLKQEGVNADNDVDLKQERTESGYCFDLGQEGVETDDDTDLKQGGAEADDDVDLDQEGAEADDDVYNYILTVVDVFSRFVFLRPLKRKSSKDVAEELRKIFRDNGIPKEIQCDRGTEFQGEVIILARNYGIKMAHSWQYHFQSQAICKKVNLIVKSMLSAMVSENNSKAHCWPDALGDIACSINTTPKLMLGYKSPFEIFFNRPYYPS